MFFSKFKSLVAGLCVLALVGCGGGGAAGDSVLGNGSGTPVLGSGNVGGPTLSVSISSPNVSSAAAATVTATVRDASGVPVPGAVLKFELGRSDLARLAADSALTNAQGMGSTGLAAVSSTVNGADTVKVTATLGTTTISGQIGYSVTGASASLQATMENTTLRVSTGAVRFRATVRDSFGAPLANQVVTFASLSGVVRVANPSGLTDASGEASTTVSAADGSVGAADTVVASVSVNGSALQSSINVQVISESPSIALMIDRAQIGTATPATVRAEVRDSNNLPVPNAVVSFTTQFGLGTFSANTAATANVSGIATVALSPKGAGSAGADTVAASVTLNGVTRTAQQVVEFVSTVTAAAPQLVLGISSSLVTAASPAQLSIRVINGAGQPVIGAVVSLSTTRGNLGVLGASSVLTGTSGTANVTLNSAASGVAGADEVIAKVTVQGVTLQESVGFTVDTAAPSLAVSATDLPVLFSGGPVSISATVLNAQRNPVSNQLVRFSGGDDQVTFSAASAITNSAGVATVTFRALNASIAGAPTLSATTSIGGRDLQATKLVSLKAESPSISLIVERAAGSSTISATAPATVIATVTDSAGVLVPDALVTFTTGGGLGVFDLRTAATGNAGAGLGVASAKLSPATTATAGADTILATVTVAGVQVSAAKVVQLSASAAAVRSPILALSLSSNSISSASPASVSASLTDASGAPVAGQVITFAVSRGLATTNIGTALTNPAGIAVAILSPANSAVAGADEVVAKAKVGGVDLEASRGFQIQATNVTIDSFTAETSSLSAYGQTSLSLALSGASFLSPVNLSITSSCAGQGKATVSPLTLTATSSPVTIQYRDNGCGAVQTADQLQAVIVGTATSRSLALNLTRPGVSSVAFVQAAPEAIFLKGSGFVETSVIRFEVRDGAGNPLPNQEVALELLTGAGGVTVQNNSGVSVGPGTVVTRSTDFQGRVEIRVNAGTQPTPVRVQASLSPTIKTVSSNLSVGIGLPSQLNFSISQATRNIEGMNIDGTANNYTVIASDRSGNPVPAGTSINFVAEGGQVEPIRQTSMVGGVARTTAGFVSADPRPEDGRVTVTAYALGEESFIDQNGNNVYDIGEPFQDLGNIFKDRAFNGVFESAVDETIPTNISNTSACVAPSAAQGSTTLTNALLAGNASIPSITSQPTCDAVWSGAGKVYVRRAIETVFSTSATRLLWANTTGLGSSCASTTLQVGSSPLSVQNFALVQGDTYYFGNAGGGSLSFIVGDANSYRPGSPFAIGGAQGRLNPVAAGSTVTATTPTDSMVVRVGGGSPVPSTSEASTAVIGVTFQGALAGIVFVTVTSPSGLATTYAINVDARTKAVAQVAGSCNP